ncbi:tetratricopeptide repeat protein [Geobacter sp. OR-1]|uniref:tetratricopeptide repeat protein n=1 Tax=Geobacter sp. OR-1 TaxID=1266765 RepID=UPI001ED9C305|nr:tetratricopeptide repeat protein [Geobacter sp. OR-1]
MKVNLGNLYKAQGKYDKAVECFTRAIQLKPDLPQAYFGLGSALELRGDNEQQTNDCYFKALSLDPSIPEVHQAVGRRYFKARKPEALDHFETAKRLNSELPEIDRDLGLAYLRYERSPEAAECLKIAVTKCPDDATARFFLAVAQGEEPDPELKKKYYQEEFDRFAPTFDGLLVDKLGYRGPSQLVDLTKEHCGNEIKFNNAIDLGCGTGLSGVAFRDHARTLSGIDISEKMLEAAAGKNCYDRLLRGNILEVLITCEEKFDLFIAADVFIYIGDLAPLFQEVKARADRNAMLVFTTESCDGEGFVLKASGRYAHSPAYIHSVADHYGFKVMGEKEVQLRTEGADWIMGNCYLLTLR